MKKKNIKLWKRVSLLLVLSMLLTALVGCGSKNDTTTEDKPAESNTDNTETNAAETEAPTDDAGDPMVIDMVAMYTYEDTQVQKDLEEKYNVKFTIEQVAADDSEAMNLYWATGNTPDVCINRNLDVKSLFRQGLVRSFPVEWLEEYAPDYMKSIYEINDPNDLEHGKEIVMSQIMVDGECVFVPRDSVTNHVGMLMCIRQDWLDALNLEVPTNVDELHDVMTAFTKDDPDGDGADDTFGMHGAARNQRFGTVFAMNQWWPNSYYMDDAGKVTYSMTTDTCKEMLTLIKTWYDEGIIDPEFVTDDRQAQRDKWSQGMFGIMVDHPWWFGKNTDNVQQMLTNVDPNARLTFMEPFADEEGVQYINTWYPDCISDASMIFGKDCPDEVIQKMLTIWNDAVTDWDWFVKEMYGEENVDFIYNADGRIETLHTEEGDTFATEDYGSLYDFVPIGTPREKFLTVTSLKGEADLYELSTSFTPFYMDLNFMAPTLDEATSQKASDVKTLSDEFYANAISGEVDLEAEWDNFQQSLIDAGLNDVIAVYEAGGIR